MKLFSSNGGKHGLDPYNNLLSLISNTNVGNNSQHVIISYIFIPKVQLA